MMRKKEIIKSSINVMYLKGYNDTSIKDITDAAGIPKSNFYSYFKDKESYAIEALEYYSTEIDPERKLIMQDETLEPLTKIKEYYKLGIENLIKKDLKYGCFAGNLAQEMGDVSQEISKAVADINAKAVLEIHKILLQAYENDESKNDDDLKMLGSFIISSWQGTMVRMKMGADSSVLYEFYIMLTKTLLK